MGIVALRDDMDNSSWIASSSVGRAAGAARLAAARAKEATEAWQSAALTEQARRASLEREHGMQPSKMQRFGSQQSTFYVYGF